MSDQHIILAGFMGTGKSTLAPLVAESLGRPWHDLDTCIEQSTGRTIAEIFSHEGETAFRQREYAMLESVLSRVPAVIATGGGTWCDARCRELLCAEGQIICLTGDPKILWERIRPSLAQRPLALDEQAFADLWKIREPIYGTIATTINTTGRTIADVVRKIVGCTAAEGMR